MNYALLTPERYPLRFDCTDEKDAVSVEKRQRHGGVEVTKGVWAVCAEERKSPELAVNGVKTRCTCVLPYDLRKPKPTAFEVQTRIILKI